MGPRCYSSQWRTGLTLGSVIHHGMHACAFICWMPPLCQLGGEGSGGMKGVGPLPLPWTLMAD